LIDASDNVATRYLVNDVAVVLGIPLVSGSALRMEGQVSVFHLHDEGPCYRCLYPTPPPPAAVTNCSDGGVLGAITGVIGSVQALEAIKILAGLVAPASAQMQAPLSATSSNFDPVSAAASMSTLNTRLLLLDGCSSSFRTMKLRGRNPNCAACGTNPTITRDTLEKQALDYQLFCGSANNDLASSRLPVHTGTVPTASVKQLHAALHPLGAGGSRAAAAADAAVGAAVVAAASTAVAASAASSPSSLPLPAPLPPLLLDVREPVQFRICALPGAINVPLRVLKQQIPAWLMQHLQPATSSSSLPLVAQSITPHPLSATVSASSSSSPSETPQQQPAQSVTIALPRDIFVMCRRGVDSVTAARLLLAHVQQQAQMIASADGAQQQQQAASASVVQLRHVSGGLQAWHDQVDASFPLY
jgi:adenylyltransferase/sulfurtransferase